MSNSTKIFMKKSELVRKMSDDSFEKLWHQFIMRVSWIQLLMDLDEEYKRPTFCSIHNILDAEPNFLKAQLKFSLDSKRAILHEIYEFQERVDLLLLEESMRPKTEELMSVTISRVPFDLPAEEV